VAEGQTFRDNLSPESLVKRQAYLEPWLGTMKPGDKVQFERWATFCMDPDSTDKLPVFNRTVGLRDSWAKIESKNEKP
jgi:glutaminyl-tRNA synthetase (EC 6.1.1.18)